MTELLTRDEVLAIVKCSKLTAERKTSAKKVADLMVAAADARARVVAQDAKGRVPEALLRRRAIADINDAVNLLVLLLRANEHELREERIKVLLTLIGEADIGFTNRRKILGAFGHAGSRHGRRVRKLRRQFEKSL